MTPSRQIAQCVSDVYNRIHRSKSPATPLDVVSEYEETKIAGHRPYLGHGVEVVLSRGCSHQRTVDKVRTSDMEAHRVAPRYGMRDVLCLRRKFVLESEVLPDGLLDVVEIAVALPVAIKVDIIRGMANILAEGASYTFIVPVSPSSRAH